MKYAKLINDYPSYAPNPILHNGLWYGNPPGSVYEAEGYKQVQYTNQPESPGVGWWVETWTETEDAIVQDSVSRTLFQWDQGAGGHTRLGVNVARLVVNGHNETRTSSTSYGANTTGRTFLGARATNNPDTTYNRLVGTIYAVRIYSRKLSLTEIQQNQNTDATYYT